MEATKSLEPSMQRTARRLREQVGRILGCHSSAIQVSDDLKENQAEDADGSGSCEPDRNAARPTRHQRDAGPGTPSAQRRDLNHFDGLEPVEELAGVASHPYTLG